ncbi:MAG: NYN domain-containing protein [Myxococcales bacterium]|nr:NYN domain-containing protein [Myxococcales bacterium]
MERVVVFLDFANIDRAAGDRGLRVDYQDLLEYVSDGRFLVDAHCYVPIDPRNEHRLDALIERLWQYRYIVNTKRGTIAADSYKCNFDVEITIDVLRVAYAVKPDIIVLASGDVDFVPLVQELRRLGIRVEVASFEAAAAREIILKCSGFISLDYYLKERAEPEPGPASSAHGAEHAPADGQSDPRQQVAEGVDVGPQTRPDYSCARLALVLRSRRCRHKPLATGRLANAHSHHQRSTCHHTWIRGRGP